jgi:hypothetical protein
MMKAKTISKEKPYFFPKFKSYDPEEILAAGGATAFGKLKGYDPKKLYHFSLLAKNSTNRNSEAL